MLSFRNEDVTNHALLEWLDDFEVGLRDEFAFGSGDNIQLAENRPQDEQKEYDQQQAQHGSCERCWRLRLDT